MESYLIKGLRHVYMNFDGQWLPNVEPELIGPQNFKTLQNMRYRDGGIEGTQGSSKINTSIVNTVYYRPLSGYHFKKDRPAESHVLLQCYNYNGTKSKVFENKTDIPDQGNFETDAIHDDEPYGTTTGAYGHHTLAVQALFSSGATHGIFVGASQLTSGATHGIVAEEIDVDETITSDTLQARFCEGPMGHVVYSNGVESMVWGGDASRTAAFVSSTSNVQNSVTNPRDFTVVVNNEYTTVGESAAVSSYVTGGTAYFLVGAPRPISGISFYQSVVNPLSGKTVYCQEWNNSTWADLNITNDTSLGLSQTSGKVSFPSTVSTSKPKFLAGRLLYWYQCRVEGGASIYNVTLDIPWQGLVDLWDGEYRTCIGFHAYRNGDYKDWTLDVAQGSSDLYPIGAEIGGMGTKDHVILMFSDRMQAIQFKMLSGNTSVFASGITHYTWDGTDFVRSGVTYDETAGGGVTPLGQSGILTWSPPEEGKEFRRTLFGRFGYAYKIEWGGVLGGTGPPDDAVIIDLVYGIPAPLKVDNFKFPVFYKNRLFLLGYLKGNTPNRIDFCAPNSVDVWNGSQTSHDGKYSLYVGGGEEISAAIQIYNRYGSDLTNNLLIFKNNETYMMTGNEPTGTDKFLVHTISKNIGCPAPFTLVTAEVGYEMIPGELQRNVVLWLSATGPILFDGSTPVPVHGIDSYFDEAHVNYVGTTAISLANGWYDSYYGEYNLRVGDHWFAYDLRRRRWFSRDTGVAELPRFAFPVTDTKGMRYMYAGMDDGYLRRLENGTTWDGTSIEQIIETGDFPLDGDPWHETRLRTIKLGNKVISEAATVRVDLFKNSGYSGKSVFSVALNSGSNNSSHLSSPMRDENAVRYRFKYTVETSGTSKGFQPLGYGYEYSLVKEDR